MSEPKPYTDDEIARMRVLVAKNGYLYAPMARWLLTLDARVLAEREACAALNEKEVKA